MKRFFFILFILPLLQSGFSQPNLPTPKVKIEVMVIGDQDHITENLIVTLMRQPSNSCTYDTVASRSQINSDSSFLFTEIDTGSYLLSARVVDQEYVTYFSPHYRPTYYPETDIWYNAQPIKLNSDTALNVEMYYSWIPQDAFAWGTEVIGTLLYNSSPVTESTILIKRYVGNKHASASTDSLFEIYHFTTTDDNGHYHFYGIEEGLYQLDVDLPGIAMNSMPTINNSGLQGEIILVDFRANECLINAEVTYPVINNTAGPKITISPNPADDFIEIEDLHSESQILLTDLTGHTVVQTNQQHMKISHLPNGIYLILVPATGFTGKVSVQH